MRLLLRLAVAGVCAALACPAALDAQTASSETSSTATGDSAYGALHLVGKTLGRESLDRVVEVTGRDGSPQPSLWKITLAEPTGGTRVVEVAGGKITGQHTDAASPSSKGTIRLGDLNLDSSGAFDATDAQARKVHLRFDSVNYALRTSDDTGKPQWKLTLFNQSGNEVGVMRLGANDGNIISIDGRLATVLTPVPTATLHPPAVVTATVHPRPTATPVPRVVESHPATTTTTTTTTVIEPSPPPPPVPLTDTVVVDTTAPDDGDGGLFTRTGRTLDKTSRKVEQTLRHTGTRVQRFFTGRGSDGDQDAPPPPPPVSTRDPNYRGD